MRSPLVSWGLTIGGLALAYYVVGVLLAPPPIPILVELSPDANSQELVRPAGQQSPHTAATVKRAEEKDADTDKRADRHSDKASNHQQPAPPPPPQTQQEQKPVPPPSPPLSANDRDFAKREEAIQRILFRNYANSISKTQLTAEELQRHPLWNEMVAARCPLAETKQVAARQMAKWAQKPITEKMLNTIYCIRKNVARVSITDGKLRIVSYQLSLDLDRLQSGAWLLHLVLLRAAARGEPLPDVEFVVNPTDWTSAFAKGRSTALSEEPLPLFCNAACDGDDSISFPLMLHAQLGSPDGFMSLPLFKEKYEALYGAGTLVPFDEKRDYLFFSATNVRGNRAKLLSTQ